VTVVGHLDEARTPGADNGNLLHREEAVEENQCEHEENVGRHVVGASACLRDLASQHCVPNPGCRRARRGGGRSVRRGGTGPRLPRAVAWLRECAPKTAVNILRMARAQGTFTPRRAMVAWCFPRESIRFCTSFTGVL
jgi:hypothetical protein